ncbi:hypothetical protein Cni_G24582 [Canna indica]|uniref:Uncharacterized protein n=1 Tax=Canna indica TaxID=4628 RepID=A0AAQ3QK87_9LILI|nr:hypothetical protein Cni_G24582 [Canna indica]
MAEEKGEIEADEEEAAEGITELRMMDVEERSCPPRRPAHKIPPAYGEAMKGALTMMTRRWKNAD